MPDVCALFSQYVPLGSSIFALTTALALYRAGNAHAEVGPVPAAVPIAGTSMCLVDGWEYAPRWSPSSYFPTVHGTPTAADCALKCEADTFCTGATYITNPDRMHQNCWFKDWGNGGPAAPPCLPEPDISLNYQVIIDPAGADCASIVYMDLPTLECDVEAWIEEKPSNLSLNSTSNDAGAYQRYPGKDYDSSAGRLLPVQDLDGLLVETIEICESQCDSTPTCNAATFYSTQLPDTGKNCNLQVLGTDVCALPVDADDTPHATLSVKCGTHKNMDAMDSPAVPPTPPTAAGGVGAPESPSPVRVFLDYFQKRRPEK